MPLFVFTKNYERMIAFKPFITVAFFFFCNIYFTYSQRLTSFSENRVEFLTQLETFMSSSKQKKLIDAFEAVEPQIKSAHFSEEEFKTIHLTANKMLKQRMVASGYFSEYLKSLSIVKKDKYGEQRFKDWHQVLNGILDDIKNRKIKPYKDFLKFSYSFFDKASLRFSKSGTTWLALAEAYKMTYQDGQASIIYEQLDIVGKKKKNQIRIAKTKGTYYPIKLLWKGEGGKVTWERLDMSSDIYCELGTYEIQTKKSEYHVKEVSFYHPELFPNTSVTGSFTDKVIVQSKTSEGSYPRFESNKKILKINKFGNRLEYTGGFKLNGSTVNGFGTPDQKASIVLYNTDGTKKFKGVAESFLIRRQELIVGQQVESTIYFGQDSIYHPSVNLKYNIVKSELSLMRGKRGSDRNPFYNSFHKVNIYADKINWYLDNDSLVINEKKFNVGNGSDKVTVESVNYFDSRDYRRLQNIADTNPLATLKLLVDEEGVKLFDANKLAKRLNPKFDVTSIQTLLYDLVSQGFINYYSDRKQIEVKDKVFHYASASQSKKDFDVLKLISDTEDSNAFFDISQKKITTGGIKILEFSSKQKTALKPTNAQIILKQNRNMDFDGKMFSGFSTMQGKDFSFDYDKFQVKMDSVRYFDLFVPTGEKDKHGDPIALSIGSRIEHATGILLIDGPGNKSGKDDIPMFPSFQSKKKSFVYYDDKSILGGCYSRDSFYFQLSPFSFNSLDDFTEAALVFKGNLVSADIFPNIKEPILLQEDKSLGFVHQTPKTGYPNYKGKGNYIGELALSNKGFLAKGNIEYLWSNINSTDIIYKPKQMLCSAEAFDLQEDRTTSIQVPKAFGEDVKINWRPYKDSMYIQSNDTPFKLFQEDRHTLKGTLILTPGGLKAKGVFDWDEGTLTSNLLSFGAFSANADTADVKIKAFETDNFAFDTKNVKAKVDFDKKEAWFKANELNQITTMPYNQYITTMNEFTWDMDAQTITFVSDENILGAFTSIHPEQDSLKFGGRTAFYDLKTNELIVGGVPQIPTADAYIIPDSNKVEIQKGGIMTTLRNAKIIANQKSKYHVINRATVVIKGGKEYKASGFYEYNIADKKQEIKFTNIIGEPFGKGKRSEKPVVTRATGEVTDEDKFLIDHKTEFRGQITLNASEQNLQFDGFAKLNAPLLNKGEWFSIKSKGDKNNLVISFDEPKSYEGDPIRVGIFLSKETAKSYPRVMQPTWFRKDRAVLDARGAFLYDQKADAFVFGDSLRITGNARTGNKMVYSNKDASIVAEGLFNIGSGMNKVVNVKAAGRMKSAYGGLRLANGKLTKEGLFAELFAGIDVPIPEKLIKLMVIDIKTNSYDAPGIPYTNDEFYELTLPEFISKSKALRGTLDNMKSTRTLIMPAKTGKHTFLFSKLPMKWDDDYQSFVSTGTQIGLNAITGENIDLLCTAFMEFKMPSNEDDRWYFYLKSPSDYYYYFQYKQGVLSMVSSNREFNEIIEGMKDKERIIKLDNGETIEIQAINHGTAEMFLKRIKAAQSRK